MSPEREGVGELREQTETSEAPAHEFVDRDVAERRLQIRTELGHPPDVGRLSEQNESVQGQIEAIELDEAEGRGHACAEHLRPGEEDLAQRALDGTRARGGQDRVIPRNATKFTTETGLVAAEQAAWNDPKLQVERIELERQYTEAKSLGMAPEQFDAMVRDDMTLVSNDVRLEDALGPDWRDHVYGRTKASGGQNETVFPPDSKVKVVWRMSPDGRWYLETCFPQA